MPKLTIEEQGKKTLYEILEDEVGIGRAAPNQIQLGDRRASKLHGRIRKVYGRWKYIDLESKNGTRVNGRFRNQRWLEPGDTLQIGEVRIGFEAAIAPAVPTPAEAATPPGAAGLATPPPVAEGAAPAAAAPAGAPPAGAEGAAAPATDVAASPEAAPGVPKPSRSRPGRRRRGRKDDGESKRDPALVPMIAMIGAAIVFGVVILIIRQSGVDNGEVLMAAHAIYEKKGEPRDAAEYALRNAGQDEIGYDDVKAAADRWQRIANERDRQSANDLEGAQWLPQALAGRVAVPGEDPPEDALTDDQVVEKLKAFLRDYGRSTTAEKLVDTGEGEPWETYRRLLKEHAAKEADVGAMLEDLAAEARPLVVETRFADAIDLYRDARRNQAYLLAPKPYEEFARRVDAAIESLQQEAKAALERDLIDVDHLIHEDRQVAARARLLRMIDNYGIEPLVEKAREKLATLTD